MTDYLTDPELDDDEEAAFEPEPVSAAEPEPPEADLSSRLAPLMNWVRHAFASGRPAQAYLVTGPVREEGSALARWIGQYLFCSAASEPERPCGVCPGCRSVAEGLCPDVHWFYPEKKSRVIGIDMMREGILAQMQQTALGNGWKIAVIAGADRFNDAAANAFLKTLEEPPPRTLFILLADSAQSVLPTILSRCQRLDAGLTRELREPWRGMLLDILAHRRIASPLEAMAAAGAFCAVFAQMEALAEKCVKEERRKAAVDEEEDVFKARVASRYREWRGDAVLLLLRWMQDLLRTCAAGAQTPLHYGEFRETFLARAANLSLAQALENIDMVEKFALQLERNINENTTLPYWFDRFHHGWRSGSL